jgi:hypothetical protein
MGFIKDWQQGVIEHLEFYLAAVKRLFIRNSISSSL